MSCVYIFGTLVYIVTGFKYSIANVVSGILIATMYGVRGVVALGLSVCEGVNF